MSNNNFWEKKQNLCVLLDIDLLSVARGTDFGESRACLGVYEEGLVQAVETNIRRWAQRQEVAEWLTSGPKRKQHLYDLNVTFSLVVA